MESSFCVFTLTLTESAAGEADEPGAPAPLDWWYCKLRLAGEGVLAAAGGGDMSARKCNCDSDDDGSGDGDVDLGILVVYTVQGPMLSPLLRCVARPD